MKPSYRGITHHLCRKRKGLDGVYHCFLYDGVVRRILFKTKYGLRHQLLTHFLTKYRKDILEGFYSLIAEEKPILVPVPLHSSKVKRRGFNQAEILARWLAKETGIPLRNTVERIRNTPPQSALHTPKARMQNIIGAFRLRSVEDIKDKSIVIIDDIWTSGNTAKEITRLLKQAGSSSVYLFTIAGPYGH